MFRWLSSTTEIFRHAGGLQPEWPRVHRSLPLPHAYHEFVCLEFIAGLCSGAKYHKNRVDAIYAYALC